MTEFQQDYRGWTLAVYQSPLGNHWWCDYWPPRGGKALSIRGPLRHEALDNAKTAIDQMEGEKP